MKTYMKYYYGMTYSS